MTERRVLTASEIATWKQCPHRWMLRYQEGLLPMVEPGALSYGSMIHDALACYYRGQDLPTMLPEIKALILGYILNDPIKALGHAVLAVEGEGIVPLRSPSGRKSGYYSLAYKVDLRTADQAGNQWLVEHKSSSFQLNRDWLPLAEQPNSYLWAEWQAGHQPVGTLWNMVRKPTIKQREKETPEDYAERLAGDIASRPEFYYIHELIVKSPQDLLAIQSNLWEVAHLIGRHPILRNPSACQTFSCPYRELCISDSALARSAGYRKERPHIELSEEVLQV